MAHEIMVVCRREFYVANAIHKFKDRDVKRVIRASQMAGIEIGSIEVDPNAGTIKIITNKPSAELSGANPWDRKHAANKKRSA
jgi:hypothetical protein